MSRSQRKSERWTMLHGKLMRPQLAAELRAIEQRLQTVCCPLCPCWFRPRGLPNHIAMHVRLAAK